jgi:hypothetical protein
VTVTTSSDSERRNAVTFPSLFLENRSPDKKIPDLQLNASIRDFSRVESNY